MSKEQNTDENLFAQIKRGDNKAFRTLFDRYYQILLAIAINILRDVNTAKDTVQEVFFQIWKKRDSINIKTNPEAYLKRATINRSLNHIKSRKRITGTEQMEEMHSKIPSANEELEAEELDIVIKKALDSLPERCRLVFVMKRYEGLSLKEIGAKLDISPKTAENQITKALKVLKEAVKPYVT